ncbi:MAG: Tfp pilus assembly protein FimT/FimU [Lachnospirales bacterium]
MIKSKKGFALLEVIIVTIMFIAIVNISLSYVSFIEKNNIEKNSNIIVNVLKECRIKSIENHRTYSISFTTENDLIIQYLEEVVQVEKIVNLEDIDSLSLNSTTGNIVYIESGTTSTPCTILIKNGEYKGVITINLGSGMPNFKGITKN